MNQSFLPGSVEGDAEAEGVGVGASARDVERELGVAWNVSVAREDRVVVELEEAQGNAPAEAHVQPAAELHGEARRAVVEREVRAARRGLNVVRGLACRAEEGVGERLEGLPFGAGVLNLGGAEELPEAVCDAIGVGVAAAVREEVGESLGLEVAGEVGLDFEVAGGVI